MASFTFIASNCLSFDALTLENQPLGGTETAVIRLAEALVEIGHSVEVYTRHSAPRSSTVKYKSISTFNENFQTDVLIAARDWLAAMTSVKAKRRYFWTGDAFDQSATFGIGDKRVSNFINGLICVSAWHATTLSSHSGFPIEKTFVIRNGVYLPYFSEARVRHRKRLIYSSTPYRGLYLIPPMLKKLRELHPEVHLEVYSGYDVYGGGQGHDIESFENFAKQIAADPTITLHRNVTQKALAQGFLESSILFYPNCFPETSCITALEAQAAGCVVLSSNLAALPETVGDCGILVDGVPGSSEYQNAFISAADKLLSDDLLWQTLSLKSIKKIRKEYSWSQIALKFADLTLPKDLKQQHP